MSATSAPSLRSTLSHICAALEDLGVAGVTPDAFHQAHQAEQQVAKALHTLIILNLAGFPQDCQHHLAQFWHQVADEHAQTTLPEQGFQFINWQLTELGYPRADQFCTSAQTSHREILLAFGWLLAKTDALQHALKRRLCKKRITALLPPYPQADATQQQASHAALSARQHVQQVLQVCASQQDWAQVQIASQHALMLQAKCKAKAKSLQALQQSQCKLHHKLTQLQADGQLCLHPPGSKKVSSLTPYEWSLLQSNEKLQRHQQSLEAAACIARECQQAEQHSRAFLQWLATLLQQAEPSEASPQQGSEMAPLLSHGISPATVPQLQQVAPSLQTKLHAAMQACAPSTGPNLPIGSVPGPLLSQIQCEVHSQLGAIPDLSRRTALPPDIQQKVEAVNNQNRAITMPWNGFQLPARSVVHTCFADRLPASGSTSTAKAEIARLTRRVLETAKTLAKVRAAHKQSLQKVVAGLHEDAEIVVHL